LVKVSVALVVIVLALVWACVVMAGWAYQGPRRLLRRLRLHKAIV